MFVCVYLNEKMHVHMCEHTLEAREIYIVFIHSPLIIFVYFHVYG